MNLNILVSEESVRKVLNDFREFEKSGPGPELNLLPAQLASMIDHTMLKPEASLGEIQKLCEEAMEYSFASVCVNSSFVENCFDLVKSSGVRVCSVIGFPLGVCTTQTKFAEAEEAIRNGAEELDMVINTGKLKDKNFEYVFNDIRSIADLSKKHLCLIKVILETCLLTDEEKVCACILSKEAGADFVKTSTGFSRSGATVHDVSLMKFVVGNSTEVKASGGIRSYEDAVAMINAGATRLGASAGVKIMSGLKSDSNY